MRHLAALFSLVAVAAGLVFDGNLNYASPSRRHASLGIDVELVERRLKKRSLSSPSDYQPPTTSPKLHFTHGVASGDPWPESVILWTRVAPTNESNASEATVNGTAPLYSHETERFIKADAHPICVAWSVYESQGPDGRLPGHAVAAGQTYTTSDIDYTVKVEAKGLTPHTQYLYQFTICGTKTKSPLGRTKTAPRPDDDVSSLSFAVFSCSNYPNGYFNAYGNAARKDQHDYVIHLGDYIYEYNLGGPRAARPSRILFTLHDYRTRHGQYRSDADLQLLSKDFAWIPTWDDHEFANNGYRDGFQGLNNTEDSFLNKGPRVSVDTRKVNAVRSYFEWMPIRQTDLDDGLRVWRSFQMGKLLDLIMVDTRNYDRSITSLDWNDDYIDLIRDDASRTLMGARQENWFYRSLTQSQERGATWRVVGNQIIFSRVFEDDSGLLSGDNWNGYIANRNRTLQHLYDNKMDNTIFLSGDSHENWVSDLAWLGTRPYDKDSGKGAVGVEFAGTAVSSGGHSRNGPIEPTVGNYSRGMIRRNDEMQWQEGWYRGYFVLSISPDAATARYFGTPSVATRNSWDISLANFTIRAGQNHLERPVAGGVVESGALRGGRVRHTNQTLNTDSGEYKVVGFDKMYL
ncbi:hypothetical protein CDD81_1079 [Ophiocordyceps australis]|uniref:PhoD-like phosphatase metallophosphatase domain-containing protein n=1 Tax=Ophiocordyceps australis TaxID=1399860 RepID=A0A2C5Y1P3_9HYPO|nr:hypothetical protein CDD81_1079 [Ophiocordyceps australis]